MNTNFIYSAPTTVYFGENKLEHLGGELKKYGTRVLVTYGGGSIKKIGLYDRVMEELKKGGFEVYEYGGIEPNPRHTSVNEGAAICKEKGIDVLLAVGGGSTIDATKAMGAAAFYDGDAWDLVTQKAPVANCLPIVTILTLAATGSEMDFFSVISNMEDNDKLGLGHPSMLPRASFLDPTNTYSVSPFQTACGGADILSHLFDTAYFSTQPGLFMVDHFMEGLMKAVIRYTPVAIQEPTHYEARANLMWASSWALNGFTMTGKMQAPS